MRHSKLLLAAATAAPFAALTAQGVLRPNSDSDHVGELPRSAHWVAGAGATAAFVYFARGERGLGRHAGAPVVRFGGKPGDLIGTSDADSHNTFETTANLPPEYSPAKDRTDAPTDPLSTETPSNDTPSNDTPSNGDLPPPNDGAAGHASLAVSEATTTPEPGAYALLGTGLIGLLPLAHRRRK